MFLHEQIWTHTCQSNFVILFAKANLDEMDRRSSLVRTIQPDRRPSDPNRVALDVWIFKRCVTHASQPWLFVIDFIQLKWIIICHQTWNLRKAPQLWKVRAMEREMTAKANWIHSSWFALNICKTDASRRRGLLSRKHTLLQHEILPQNQYANNLHHKITFSSNLSNTMPQWRDFRSVREAVYFFSKDDETFSSDCCWTDSSRKIETITKWIFHQISSNLFSQLLALGLRCLCHVAAHRVKIRDATNIRKWIWGLIGKIDSIENMIFDHLSRDFWRQPKRSFQRRTSTKQTMKDVSRCSFDQKRAEICIEIHQGTCRKSIYTQNIDRNLNARHVFKCKPWRVKVNLLV